ncbi:MAG: DUF504 domain-containing protein [Betaproteobacteria bacterium]|nr:MAG: DUF504 domain-containing protein [Betaproteobacteria bacterium]
MMPIQDLLNRIRWDEQFGRGKFVIGYYDRVADNIVKVPFERIQFREGEHFAFEAIEADGSVHNVPFHRVREVWRDNELIWHRDEPPGS